MKRDQKRSELIIGKDCLTGARGACFANNDGSRLLYPVSCDLSFCIYIGSFGNDNVILLQPNKPNLPILKIARPNAEISLIEASEFDPTSFGPMDRSFRCFGIYGMISMLAGKYLLLVTERSLIGVLPRNDADVYAISGVQIVPCGRDIRSLSFQERYDETEFLRLLYSTLHAAPMAVGLYYSPQADLTRSLQAQMTHPASDLADWKLPQKESQFMVNQVHLDDFIHNSERAALAPFTLACIQGFVETRELQVEQSRITFVLISRRNTRKTGKNHRKVFSLTLFRCSLSFAWY